MEAICAAAPHFAGGKSRSPISRSMPIPVAWEGGFDLDRYPAIRAHLARPGEGAEGASAHHGLTANPARRARSVRMRYLTRMSLPWAKITNPALWIRASSARGVYNRRR